MLACEEHILASAGEAHRAGSNLDRNPLYDPKSCMTRWPFCAPCHNYADIDWGFHMASTMRDRIYCNLPKASLKVSLKYIPAGSGLEQCTDSLSGQTVSGQTVSGQTVSGQTVSGQTKLSVNALLKYIACG
ncbi:hypothetical protein BaRGS_00011248, partial [Batillaria attramentaria]